MHDTSGTEGAAGTGTWSDARTRWLTWAALAVIVAVAIAVRYTSLATNPGGLYPDEAAEGLDAQRLLHVAGFHAVFFPDDGGREALFAYIVAAAFRFLGETVLVLRGTSAALGVLGVLAAWLLGRRFGAIAGLAGAAWSASALWLIAIDRDGMRNAMVPLFGAVALVSLLAWLDRSGRRSAILAGVVCSIASLYTYQPLKLIPLLIVVWLVWLRRSDRPAFERLRPGFGPGLAAFLLVGLPMLAVAVTDPSSYFGRTVGVTPLNPGVTGDSSLVVHWLRTLGMFVVTGDPNARHDVAGLPLLGWPIGVLALVGLWRLWRRRGDGAHALILWSLPVFLLPPLVATEGGSPHFLRSLGLAAPLAVTVGLGAAEIVGQVRQRRGDRGAIVAGVLVAAGFATLAAGSAAAYLARPVADRYDAFSFDVAALAGLSTHGASDVVIVDDYSAMTVQFLDAGRLPTIVPPGTALHDRPSGGAVLALRRADLETALGSAAAATARAVAWDPAGRPTVWEVGP